MPDFDQDVIRLAIVEETPTVDKVMVQNDAVRVYTSVEERELTVEDTVQRAAFQIKRVPMDQAVDFAPAMREEGTTTIISLVEERLVTEKRLFVVEEIHITREQTQEHVAIPVTLRAMRATIERPLTDTTQGEPND